MSEKERKKKNVLKSTFCIIFIYHFVSYVNYLWRPTAGKAALISIPSTQIDKFGKCIRLHEL